MVQLHFDPAPAVASVSAQCPTTDIGTVCKEKNLIFKNVYLVGYSGTELEPSVCYGSGSTTLLPPPPPQDKLN